MLYRRTDRLRARLGIGLLLAVLVALPVVMASTGDRAHRHFSERAESRERDLHRTEAVLVADAPDSPAPRPVEAEVRFTGPDGGTAVARTDVEPGLPALSTVPVWVAADGRLTDPPMTRDEIRSRAAGWSLLAALTLAAAAAAAYALASHALHRRDLAAWETEWSATAPRRPMSP
ncbi:hypothetical protein [Streptomyces sp. CRN 30]|uniref:Rv1733c family protein n=1 Tax=Streptomyces sp. CRN 30 TaxID=3075613 RepID=UPI002A7FDF5E|nr:hypothetical protein [Streptomyces sp. CRN 30]